MPTAAFLSAWNRTNRSAVVLVEVVLTSADGLSTKTLHLSTRGYDTPDAVHWVGCIVDPGTVQAPGEFLSADVGLCSQSVTIAGREVVDGALTAFDLMHGWVWCGASVTTRLWEDSLTDFADAATMLTSTVQRPDIVGETLVLSLRQRVDWNGPVAPEAVERKAWPNCSDDTINAAIPTRYGSATAVPARAPMYAEAYPFSNVLERVNNGRRAGRGVLVDAGRGDRASVALFASHKMKSCGVQESGTSMFLDTGGALAALKGDVVAFNADTGTGVTLDDNAGCAYLGLKPDTLMPIPAITVGGSYCTPEDSATLLDPTNDNNFCRIRWTMASEAGSGDLWFHVLRLRFAALPDVGDVMGIKMFVVYRHQLDYPVGGGGGLRQLRFVGWSSDPGYLAYRQLTGTEDWQLWEFDASDYYTAEDLRSGNAGFQVEDYGHYPGAYGPPSGAARTASEWNVSLDIAVVGVEVQFVPKQNMVGSATRAVSRTRRRPTTRQDYWRGSVTTYEPYAAIDTVPAEQEVTSKFFANSQGMRDALIGVYTGQNNYALIQRPCDIAQHILTVYGKQVAAQIEKGTGTVGSFVDARALLKTWRASDMVLGIAIADSSDVLSVLSWLAASSLSWVLLSPYDNKWHFHVWRTPAAASRTIAATQLVALPQVGIEATSSIATAIKVAYGYDDATGAYLHECSISPARSSAGFKRFNQPDESIVVTAGVNDKVDIGNSCTTVKVGDHSSSYVTLGTLTISPASYTVASFCLTLKALLVMMKFVSRMWSVGVGGVVVSGVNDMLGWLNNGTVCFGYLTPGVYTMESLAAHAQAVMRANTAMPGQLHLVTYSRTDGKFAFTKGDTSSSLGLAFGTEAGGIYLRSAAALFGFTPTNHSGSVQYVSEATVEEGLVTLTASVAFSLLWRTGSNGYVAQNPPKTAHEAFGFCPYHDTPTALYATGVVVKGNRQAALLASARRYISTTATGPARRELLVEARYVYDDDTALELRNRIADLRSVPHPVVSVPLEGVVGIERGEVIEFDGDMDALRTYPDPDSDGSWVGKKLIVVETEQRLGPDSYFTEVVAVAI